MAERRMFAKTIVLSDAFLDMPITARCLYFTLGMVADDDGFVNAPKSIIRQIGASEDDIKILIAKKFILPFDSGLIVIKHWRINNYLRADRYQETKYIDEKGLLSVEKNGAYGSGIPSSGIPRLGKVRKGKVSLGKDIYSDSGAKAPVYFPLDQQLDDAVKEFIKMRNKIKKPMTDRAITMMINKITKLKDNNKAIDCLNDSTFHCWQDIYPDKEREQKKTSSNPFADMLEEMNNEE